MSIFCHQCGKALEAGDIFCEFCGANVSVQKVAKNEHAHTKRSDLEKKAWYRGIKVLYLIFVVVSFLIVLGVSWSLKPERAIDGYNSSILCHSGTSYSPSKNSIYLYGSSAELDSSDDQDARILCKYDTLNFYNHRYETIEKNYLFLPKFIEADYGSWAGYSVLALFILWVTTYLLKISFFYITIGEKPQIKIPE